MNPTCKKCGALMTGPRYHRSWVECLGDAPSGTGEHLHYRCVCGWSMTRPTKDAKTVGQEREP